MRIEHYCTLFDSKFLPAGICLYESLLRLGEPFRLWILCMDSDVMDQLRKLALPHVSLLSLEEIESPALLAVKGGRSRGEYCWTLTPFLPELVMGKSNAERVTYLDADLFFFRSPAPIFREFDESGAHVLITEHAFDPEYERSELAGRFCVQFMPFRNTSEAREILRWWQERCLEWCFAVPADGKFGDQKYLDQWPGLFGSRVRVLMDKRLALAPWNVNGQLRGIPEEFLPVFFHFHGLRLTSESTARLFEGYHVKDAGLRLYERYLESLRASTRRLLALGISVPFFPEIDTLMARLRRCRQAWMGRTVVRSLA